MARWMLSGDVPSPPPTSTSGIMCGGLKGWPSTTRCGALHSRCMPLTGRPELLLASSTCGGTAASIRAYRSALRSARSGPFSCTKSQPSSARSRAGSKRRRSSEEPSARPMRSNAGQWRCTASRRRCSAPGAGSVAVTSRLRARKKAAQLAPMTPVPTMPTRRMAGALMMPSSAGTCFRRASSRPSRRGSTPPPCSSPRAPWIRPASSPASGACRAPSGRRRAASRS